MENYNNKLTKNNIMNNINYEILKNSIMSKYTSKFSNKLNYNKQKNIIIKNDNMISNHSYYKSKKYNNNNNIEISNKLYNSRNSYNSKSSYFNKKNVLSKNQNNTSSTINTKISTSKSNINLNLNSNVLKQQKNILNNECKIKNGLYKSSNNVLINNSYNINNLINNEKIKQLPNCKSSFKCPNSSILGYSVNTFSGLIRNYNEDRVSIIINIKPKFGVKHWPACSYFAVFDGHGGNKCADYLKDNLHSFIINNQNFPNNPKKALQEGFELCENQFISTVNYNIYNSEIDRSGSCALVCLIIKNDIYIANLGDSRAVISQYKGNNAFSLTRDHKPDDINEKERIESAGGFIYKNKAKITIADLPYRISPGGLSVSRSFGDIYAKDKSLGGNSRVLIAEPEITNFLLTDKHDFIILGCDGIWDKLSNEQVVKIIWNEIKDNSNTVSLIKLENVVNNVLKEAMIHRSLDNITVILIAFKNLIT